MRDHDSPAQDNSPARDNRPAEPSAEAFDRIEAAWSDLRGPAGAIPRRRDLDVCGIGEALPHAFLMSRVAPGIARLRVAGEAVTGLLGMDPRGMPLSVFFSGAARDPLAAHVTALFDGPSLLDLPLRSAGRLGLARRSGRLLLLPLQGDDGLVTHAVGVLGLSRLRTGRVSLDLAGAPTRCETLQTAPRQQSDPPGSDPHPARAAQARNGMAEAPRPFLRLVVDNG